MTVNSKSDDGRSHHGDRAEAALDRLEATAMGIKAERDELRARNAALEAALKQINGGDVMRDLPGLWNHMDVILAYQRIAARALKAGGAP